MSFIHRLIDFSMGLILLVSLCKFIAYHNHRRTQRRNWRVGSPSVLCERTGDWRANLPSLARRQGE